MAEFDVPGLRSARVKLTTMAKEPQPNKSSGITRKIITELYCEIRDARIAGYSWQKIADAIIQATNIKLTGGGISQLFRALDLKYERETGVEALPVGRNGRGKGR